MARLPGQYGLGDTIGLYFLVAEAMNMLEASFTRLNPDRSSLLCAKRAQYARRRVL